MTRFNRSYLKDKHLLGLLRKKGPEFKTSDFRSTDIKESSPNAIQEQENTRFTTENNTGYTSHNTGYVNPQYIIRGKSGIESNITRPVKTRRWKSSVVTTAYVKDINVEVIKPQRGGVIIYTCVGNNIYFGMGLDSRTHDLTDFGGRIKYRTDGNAIRGALREFREESLEIFDTLSVEDVKHCPVLCDSDDLIIFIYVEQPVSTNLQYPPGILIPNTCTQTTCDSDSNLDAGSHDFRATGEIHEMCTNTDEPDIISHNFHIKYKESMTKQSPEVCAITWLSVQEFQSCIQERGIIFERVRDFLGRAGDFYHLFYENYPNNNYLW